MIQLTDFSIERAGHVFFTGLNVTFQSGQFWGILGRNGLGKTTLLNQIAGLLPSNQNSVFINDVPIESLGIQQRAQWLSYLLQIQEPCLDFTVLQAVAMGQFAWQPRRTDWSQARGWLEQLKIEHLADRSLLQLSGGERRKVELATCLAQRSPHLILDEPLNHLDMVYQKFLLAQLTQISHDQSVIMVCHDLNAVQNHCTHALLLLADGCYLAGESATILSDKNLQRLFDD